MKSDWILIILSIIVGIVLTLIVVFSGIELNRRDKEKDYMKNKIEVGEYVRTKNGFIAKVDSLCGMIENTVHLENQKWFDIKNIVKHSKQLIDLIEKDDYVNGSKVLAVMENMETGELHLEMTSNYTNEKIGDCTIYDKDIKIILTKESYMANCYKVGGEDE